MAAATARARLLGVASLRWKLPVAELEVRDGVVSHASGPRAHYGELAEQAALSPPGDVTLKARSAWRVIGHRRAATGPAGQMRRPRRLRPRRASCPTWSMPACVHAPMLGGSLGHGRCRRGAAATRGRARRAAAAAGRRERRHRGGGAHHLARARGCARIAGAVASAAAGVLDSKRIEAALEAAARDAAERRGGFAFHSRGDSEGCAGRRAPARRGRCTARRTWRTRRWSR